MGKRSNFERIPRDFYQTPLEAVLPLLDHLPLNTQFIEPCAGDGALVRHLEASGHTCIEAYDIEPQNVDIYKADALQVYFGDRAEYLITNPPWDRNILHPLIDHFSAQVSTWLLFDADWIHTKQSIPYLNRLRSIVSIGRIKWIPDSKMTGKDNCAWYLFVPEDRNPGEITFYGRN
jgi:hypothetical protein